MRRHGSRWLAVLALAQCLAAWTRGLAQANESSDAGAEADSEGSSDEPVTAVSTKAWALRLSGGLGLGAREFQLPMDDVAYRVETGLFPAVDLGFELERATSSAFAVGLWLRYQTSIGLVITEQHTDGGQHSRDTRSEWVEAAVRSRLRLGVAWELSALVGYALSELRPVGHLVVPAYFLGGPYLRVELQLAMWHERVRLRIGPEAQWIAAIGSELEHLGIASGGFGVGGTATLEARLNAHWSAALSYRELRSRLEASGSKFEDAARFALVYVTGAL